MVFGFLIFPVNVDNFFRGLFKSTEVIFSLRSDDRFIGDFFANSLEILGAFTGLELQIDDTGRFAGLVMGIGGIVFGFGFEEGMFGE